jgi:predicted dehydrogenase
LADVVARTGITDASTDWRTFVRRDDLDLIVVATPVDLHREMVLACCEAGKHVLCEKPVAASAADAQMMVDAAEASGSVNGVGFEFRWLPDRLALADAASDGRAGDVYFAQFTQANDLFHPSHAPLSPWMYDLERGGGLLNGAASHTIDLVRLLFTEVTSVCADVVTSIPRRIHDGTTVVVSADDTSLLNLRTAAGTAVSITLTSMAWRSSRFDVDLYGSRATIMARSGATGNGPERSYILIGEVGDDSFYELPVAQRRPRTEPKLPPGRFSSAAIEAEALMLEDWLPAFAGQPTAVPSLRDGCQVQRVIEAARSSSRGAGWVDLC